MVSTHSKVMNGEKIGRASVCVLMGGTSHEREVSLRSGEKVYEAMRKSSRHHYRTRKVILDHPDELLTKISARDLVLNCLHGGIGEDGTLQSLFEILDIPYTGTGPLGSALAMNKIATKRAFKESSITHPDWLRSANYGDQELMEKAEFHLGFPIVVKPIDQGSSIGVTIIHSHEELERTFFELSGEYGELLLEDYIEGKEITAGVIEGDGQLQALPLIELRVPSEPFYNYKAKYTPGETEFVIPADLEPRPRERTKEAAMEAHRSLKCKGYSRVDFRVDNAGCPYALEVNTLPGMTETSDLPKAAAEAGISYDQLIIRLLESAEDRRQKYAGTR